MLELLNWYSTPKDEVVEPEHSLVTLVPLQPLLRGNFASRDLFPPTLELLDLRGTRKDEALGVESDLVGLAPLEPLLP